MINRKYIYVLNVLPPGLDHVVNSDRVSTCKALTHLKPCYPVLIIGNSLLHKTDTWCVRAHVCFLLCLCRHPGCAYGYGDVDSSINYEVTQNCDRLHSARSRNTNHDSQRDQQGISDKPLDPSYVCGSTLVDTTIRETNIHDGDPLSWRNFIFFGSTWVLGMITGHCSRDPKLPQAASKRHSRPQSRRGFLYSCGSETTTETCASLDV